MPKFRTHYDTLKVSRDAPIEVIQAAYRSLARKYHPDRNGSSPEREALMKAINAAYEVLSDPVKRAEHDRWIAQQLGHAASPRDAWDGRATADRPSTDSDPAGTVHTLLNAILTVCFFASALLMLRSPGSRFIGIALLVAGWLYYKTRRR